MKKWKKVYTLVTEEENEFLNKLAEDLKMDKAHVIRWLLYKQMTEIKELKGGEDND